MVEEAVKHLSIPQLLTICALNFHADRLDPSTLRTVVVKISHMLTEVALALEGRNELKAHA